MKNIGLIIVAIAASLLFTSCESLGKLIDYGINEWEKVVPANSYDRTYIDAWQSGTGGKTLVVSGLAASILSKPSNETSQKAKNVINEAIHNLNSCDEFKSNDVANWFGAMLTMGDAMILQCKRDKIDAYMQDPEISMMIESVDESTGQIKWKSSDQYIRDLVNLRNQELESLFEDRSIEMTASEYYSLSKEKRNEIDILLLQEPIKEEQQIDIITQYIENDENEKEVSHKDRMDSLFVGGYKFNSTTLTEAQKDELNDILEYLLTDSTSSIEIVGHTCSIGSEKANYNVGMQRANNAKNYLIGKGIDAGRLTVFSEGYNCPKVSNDTPEGRSKNRRITFNVIE